MRGRLAIPRSQEEALVRVLELSDEQIDALLSSLDGVEYASSIRRLADSVSSAAGLAEGRTYTIVRVLATLSTMMDRMQRTIPQFSSDIERAAQDTGNDALKNPEIGWEAGKERFSRLLSSRTLAITAKAHALLSESEKTFCDARIILDVRPVFTSDGAEAPSAFIALHTLRVSFHTSDGLESIDIAMDSADVRLLEGATKRAREKEESAVSAIRPTGIPLMRATTHEG